MQTAQHRIKWWCDKIKGDLMCNIKSKSHVISPESGAIKITESMPRNRIKPFGYVIARRLVFGWWQLASANHVHQSVRTRLMAVMFIALEIVDSNV